MWKMRIKHFLLTLLLGATCLLVPLVTEAASESTPIQVEIKANNLRLGKIQAPAFGEHSISKKYKQYQATKDLLIQIVDERKTPKKSWQIYYQLSDFYNQGANSFAAELTLGKGTLQSLTKEQLATIHPLHIKTGATKTSLVAFNSTSKKATTRYEITIPKKAIYLTIPANIKAGTYQATQTITLQDVPQQK